MKLQLQSFSAERRFGVEIEVGGQMSAANLAAILQKTRQRQNVQVVGWGYTCHNNYWAIKPDSTCGDQGNKNVDGGGYEAISPAKKGIRHLLDIADAAQQLRDGGAKANQFCGFHCQVEVADFTKLQVAALMAHWVKIEHIMSQVVAPHRVSSKGSKYCKLLSDKYSFSNKEYDPEEFWETVRPKRLDPKSKRTAVTIINYCRSLSNCMEWSHFDRKTIELRMPEGTLDPVDVKNWTRFFVHFVESSKQHEFPKNLKSLCVEDALCLMGLHGRDPFFVLSAGLYETKMWLLQRIVKFSSVKKVVQEANQILQSMTDARFVKAPAVRESIQVISVKKPKSRYSTPVQPDYDYDYDHEYN